jgi:hypothetical protein
VQLEERALELGDGVAALADLGEGVEDVAAPLLKDRALEDRLALARLDQALDLLLGGVLARDCGGGRQVGGGWGVSCSSGAGVREFRVQKRPQTGVCIIRIQNAPKTSA